MAKDKTFHINYALVARPHPSGYLMHKYWARKPHNVVSQYIKNYSEEEDVVLDPFAGSGVTAIEALKLKRKAISLDLNPISTFITRCSVVKVDINKFSSFFHEIESKLKDKINKLYETKCIKCGKQGTIIRSIFSYLVKCLSCNKEVTMYSADHAKGKKQAIYQCPYCLNNFNYSLLDIVAEELVDIDLYRCSKCGYSGSKKPDLQDKLKRQHELGSLWYPKEKFYYSNGKAFVTKRRIGDVPGLFSERNLYALAILFKEINKLPEGNIKDILLFTFTAVLGQTSKLVPYEKVGGGLGWIIHNYLVFSVHREINVWSSFDNRFKRVLKGKKELESELEKIKEAKNHNELTNGSDVFIKTHNALELDSLLPEDCVDYVFTDPPYGGSIPYLELSTLWLSWLRGTKKKNIYKANFGDEITIAHEKDFEYYHKMLTASFRQIYRVLKPGKYLTVTFHSTNIKIWNSIIRAVVLSGFDLEKIIYQPPARASAKGQLVPYGSAVGDYYMRFKKPEIKTDQKEIEPNELNYEKIVVESAKRILAERGEPTPYTYILNSIIVELKKEGALLSGTTNPDDVMEKYRNDEFILVDVTDEKGEIVGQKWWFKTPEKIKYLQYVPLSDRIETAIINVLNKKIKVSFDDILQEVFIKFPNALTPDTQSIKNILTEYAEKTSDGKWRLKASVKHRESLHNKMIFQLAILGKKAGFKIWIGQNEQGYSYQGVKLSKLCSSKILKLKSIPPTQMERVKQIDLVLYRKSEALYEFEVEHTTAISEAIVRGSNIPNENIKRYLIIPEERERFLHKKIEEPIIKENVKKYNWRFIFYNDFDEFYKKYEKKKEVELDKLEALGRIPEKKEPFKQLSLTQE